MASPTTASPGLRRKKKKVEASAWSGSGGALGFGGRRFCAALQAAIYKYAAQTQSQE